MCLTTMAADHFVHPLLGALLLLLLLLVLVVPWLKFTGINIGAMSGQLVC